MSKRRGKNFCIVKSVTFVLFFLSFLIYAGADIKVGANREEIIATLGEPQGTALRDDKEILYYPEAIITIKDGKVAHIDENRAFEESSPGHQEKGEKTISRVDEPPVKVYNEKGREIDLKTVLVPGKVTIVDFYADWCGPCRMISPHLEQLAKDDPDVFLRKIDIVSWGTPVTKQYNISSVPNIRVFDRKGNMVGKPTHNLQEVMSYVEKAK